MQTIYEKIKEQKEVRKNLIELKTLLKDEKNKRSFAYMLGGDYSVFVELLNAEDAKVRKNAALILGALEDEDLLPALFEAYQKEQQLFVKSGYLKAMSNYDYSIYLDELKDIWQTLRTVPEEESVSKHRKEELHILKEMIFRYERPKIHEFTGFSELQEILLMTSPAQKETVLPQLSEICTSLTDLGSGLRLQTRDLKSVLSIRTFTELLFPLNQKAVSGSDPKKAAFALYKSSLLSFLEENHKGSPPFYFRIELRSKRDLKEKSRFAKELAEELELLSGQSLINSTSAYEIELRFIEQKNGALLPLVKLLTIKDARFSYRKEFIPASIHPVNAATVAALCKGFLKEQAQVLDPFCGVGTMLIERNKCVPASPLYGIDIFGEAVEKAKKNARDAGLTIHFINRDFFTFTHDYLFDEIITNMPSVTRTKSRDDIFRLYEAFFPKAAEVLTKDGILILYSTEKEFVEQCLKKQKDFALLEAFSINKKEKAFAFVIQRIADTL